MAAELVALKLPAFKSMRRAHIPLGALTLLVGRNGSGKSNVLDGLAVLSALSTGLELREALDGGREGPVVRGGSEGCAPVGKTEFRLGSTTDIDGDLYHLDLTVSVAPALQIKSERLWTTRASGNRRNEPRDLLKSDPPSPYSADIVARWDNGKRGINPPVTFRATHLLTSQVAARIPATSQAGRAIHEIASQVLESLASIFILDPVSHQMREYVPERDSRLRRGADNLSAVLNRLLSVEETGEPLLSMTRSLSEAQVSDLDTVVSDLGDVMLTLKERIGGRIQPIPARLMSDGTLRFLAIACALLDSPDDAISSAYSEPRSRLLVVEELENGLHPSQAALLLGRLKSSAASRQVRTLATTHSPAILDALGGEDHRDVIVCSRDADGWSKATQLTAFPDYFEVVGKGPLGRAASSDRLRPGVHETDSAAPSLLELLGL